MTELQRTVPATVKASGEWCQRWGAGRPSWRHPSEGGFDRRRYTVELVPEVLARGFVEDRHYAGTYPAARMAFGLWDLAGPEDVVGQRGERGCIAKDVVSDLAGRALVGVAVMSVPMQARVLTSVFPDLEPYAESLELGRFVLADEVPANGESWMISQVFRAVRDAGVRGVVSFSDPMPRTRERLVVDEHGDEQLLLEQITPGHCGLIYQAANGYACGTSTARTLIYLPKHGQVLSERALSKIRTGERGADGAERHLVRLGATARGWSQPGRDWLPAALDELGARRVRHPGNYRYAWALGTTQSRVTIALPRTPYPKPAHDLLQIGA